MARPDPAMQAYYAARAREYEAIYAKPERQTDLRRLEQAIPDFFAGRRVLEIACGTGYWTRHIAGTANEVLATDLTGETLAIARSKALDPGKVRFAEADAFDLPAASGPFGAAFAGFWWSHLRKSECRAFLASLARCLSPGARVMLLDNLYVPGSSSPVARTDDEGNTWQVRGLVDGSTHEVLKNFPSEVELRADAAHFGTGMAYRALEYYWLFTFEARAAAA